MSKVIPMIRCSFFCNFLCNSLGYCNLVRHRIYIYIYTIRKSRRTTLRVLHRIWMRQTASSAHPGRTFDQILFYFFDIDQNVLKRLIRTCHRSRSPAIFHSGDSICIMKRRIVRSTVLSTVNLLQLHFPLGHIFYNCVH